MRKSLSLSSFAWLAISLAMVLAFMPKAHAALTFGATSIATGGDLSVDGVAASAFTVGTSITTGSITIGGTSQTGATTLQSANVSGATTSSGFVFSANSVTTGTASYLVSNGLTTGTALGVSSSGTIVTTGELLDLVASGATTSTGVVRITAAALTTGSALTVIGSAPATMTVAGSFLRANDGTTDLFRIGWNGHITNAQTTAPAVLSGTCTVESFATTAGTDTAGEVTATCNNQTLIITFDKAYATAPICVVSAQNTAAAAGARESYTTSTANLTITVPGNIATGIWAYHCIE